MSILDNSKCHANLILDGVLMSETMEHLRNFYCDELKSNKRKPIFNKNEEKSFNKELMQLMADAEQE